LTLRPRSGRAADSLQLTADRIEKNLRTGLRPMRRTKVGGAEADSRQLAVEEKTEESLRQGRSLRPHAAARLADWGKQGESRKREESPRATSWDAEHQGRETLKGFL